MSRVGGISLDGLVVCSRYRLLPGMNPPNGAESALASTAILVGVPPAAETRFSAGIMVQSEHVTCGGMGVRKV